MPKARENEQTGLLNLFQYMKNVNNQTSTFQVFAVPVYQSVVIKKPKKGTAQVFLYSTKGLSNKAQYWWGMQLPCTPFLAYGLASFVLKLVTKTFHKKQITKRVHIYF